MPGDGGQATSSELSILGVVNLDSILNYEIGKLAMLKALLQSMLKLMILQSVSDLLNEVQQVI